MFKKAQAATEYLIILAVVIIIALIVIGVMGGIPGLGTSGRSRVSESYWAGQTVGIESYAIDPQGDMAFTLRNNARASITVTQIDVGSSAGAFSGQFSGTVVIPAGGTSTFTDSTQIAAAARCLTGNSYAYRLNITYTDSLTGATNRITGNDGVIKLEGTCASDVA